MRAFPFATIVSVSDGEPFVSHLPVLVINQNENIIIQGHFAKANPHWKQHVEAKSALSVFHGPHGYISPSWYQDPSAVPTWNYGAVHARGVIKLVEDPHWLNEFLLRLVQANEDQKNPKKWQFDSKANPVTSQLVAILGFEIQVDSLNTKFKFSQNRSKEDQIGVINALEQLGDDASLSMVTFMKEHLNSLE